MTKLLRKSRGFTLIELMIVIAIIAILAAILIPNFMRARAQSQLAACEGNEKNLATSIEMYATDYSGNYPTSSSGGLGSNTMVQLATFEPTYVRTWPTCPVSRSNYSYNSGTTTSSNTSYSLNDEPSTADNHKAAGVPAAGSTPAHGWPIYQSSGGLVP